MAGKLRWRGKRTWSQGWHNAQTELFTLTKVCSWFGSGLSSRSSMPFSPSHNQVLQNVNLARHSKVNKTVRICWRQEFSWKRNDAHAIRTQTPSVGQNRSSRVLVQPSFRCCLDRKLGEAPQTRPHVAWAKWFQQKRSTQPTTQNIDQLISLPLRELLKGMLVLRRRKTFHTRAKAQCPFCPTEIFRPRG